MCRWDGGWGEIPKGGRAGRARSPGIWPRGGGVTAQMNPLEMIPRFIGTRTSEPTFGQMNLPRILLVQRSQSILISPYSITLSS